MNELIRLGRITAPVGIKGEMRVYPYIEDKTRFSAVKKLVIGGREYGLLSARVQKDMAVIRLAGISDRNAAEALRNKEVMIRREDLWELEEDFYFVDDILGIRVETEDKSFKGVLKDVHANPAHDLYEIEPLDENGEPDPKKSFLLPAVKEFVLKVDLEKGLMTVKLIEGMVEP